MRQRTVTDEMTTQGNRRMVDTEQARQVWAAMKDEPDTTGKLAVLAEALEMADYRIPDLIADLQKRRREMLQALRACADGNSTDYWRWQGHAELARQLLEKLGAEVPR